MVAEVALALILLAGAGDHAAQFGQTCWASIRDSTPRTCSRCMSACLRNGTTKDEQVSAFTQRLLERTARLGGVASGRGGERLAP